MKKKATIKVTPLEVAESLLRFGPGSGESAASTLKGFTADYDYERVLGEILYLRIFIVDFAVSMALGNDSPETQRILDLYYALLEVMSKESITGAEVFMKELKRRLLIYTEAVKTPCKTGPDLPVAKAFSDLCGREYDALLLTLGSIEFGTTYASVSEVIKSIKIVL